MTCGWWRRGTRTRCPDRSRTSPCRAPRRRSRGAHAVVICAPTDQRPALCVQAARAGRRCWWRSRSRCARPTRGRSCARCSAAGRRGWRRCSCASCRRCGGFAPCCRSACWAGWRAWSAAFAHAGAVEGWFDGPRAWMRDPQARGRRRLRRPRAAPRRRARRAGAGLAASRRRRDASTARVAGTSAAPRSAGFAGVPLTIRAGWATRPGGLELVVAGAAGSAVLRDGRARARRRTLGRPAARRRRGRARIRRLPARPALPARRPRSAPPARSTCSSRRSRCARTPQPDHRGAGDDREHDRHAGRRVADQGPRPSGSRTSARCRSACPPSLTQTPAAVQAAATLPAQTCD